MDPMKTTLDLSSTSDDDDNQAAAVGHPAETTTVLPSPPQATQHEFGSSSTAPPLSRPSPSSPQLSLLVAQPPSPSFPLPPPSSLVWDESWPSSTLVAVAPWRLSATSLTNVVSNSDSGLPQSQPSEFSSSSMAVPNVQPPSLPSLPSPPPLSSTQPANAVSHSVREMPHQSLQPELHSSSTTPVPKVQPPPPDSPLPSQVLPPGATPTQLPPLNPHPHPMQPQMAADNPNPANPDHQPLPLVLATPPPSPPPPPPLWAWAIDGRAKVHPLDYMETHNITTVSGEVECRTCRRNSHLDLNVADKWHETMQDYSRNSQQMEYKGRMFRAWPSPSLDCPRCGPTGFAVPLIGRGTTDGINWTFLFLARQLQHCTRPQLRHYLRATNTQGRSVNKKAWLLSLVCTSLAKQLDPNFEPLQ